MHASHLAPSITYAASRQTYYTIALLADRKTAAQAYQAYAYFRWVDDCLDRAAASESERQAFLERQKALLNASYRGEGLSGQTSEETLLADLVRSDPQRQGGLPSYLYNLMAVMNFDVTRRGRSITQAELNRYTRWLAIAVTEAMHYFIGNGTFAPRGAQRYAAVSAAHITHMLRDTREDARAGYFNVPSEMLAANGLTPQDIDAPAYRAWVAQRVAAARQGFAQGRVNLGQVACLRCQLAGLAYTARFEALLDVIEADGYLLRETYPEMNPVQALKRGLAALWKARTGPLPTFLPALKGQGAQR